MGRNTYGNCFRINNLQIHNKKSVLCVHNKKYMNICAELQDIFSGKIPFGFMGVSPWLDNQLNPISLDLCHPINKDITNLLKEQSDAHIILYYLENDKKELSEYFDFMKSIFPNAIHIICKGDTAISLCEAKGFINMNEASTIEISKFCIDEIEKSKKPDFYQTLNREGAEWANFSFDNSPKVQKRLLIIGDSISCGYGGTVANMLRNFNVDFLNTSEGTNHINIYKELDIMMDNQKYDIIHINIGIHLHNISNELYAENLRDIFKHIQEKSKSTKIVFATTTTTSKIPDITEEFDSNNFDLGDRKPCEVNSENKFTEYDEVASSRYIELNEIAKNICKDMNLYVDDLFEVCIKHNPPKRDIVHLSIEGYKLLAESVVQTINNIV